MVRRLSLLGSVVLSVGLVHAAPPNDACTSATIIASLPFSETLDVTTATTASDDPRLRCTDETGAASVWYRYTAASDVVIEASTTGSSYDTAVAVYGGACGALQPRGCVDDSLATGQQGSVAVALEAGETVLIETVRVSGIGSLRIDVHHAPAGRPAHAGPEILVNTTEYGEQGYYWYRDATSICADPSGDFVVVWEANRGEYPGGQDGSNIGIFGRRFDADGTPKGGEFQVNTYTTYQQERPEVACDSNGGFAVAWGGFGSGGLGVQARRYDAGGAPLTGEIEVDATGSTTTQSVACDAAGRFVVAYTKNAEIYARRFDTTGMPTAAPFQVNTSTAGEQREPDVAMNANGWSAIVWHDDGVGIDENVRARTFNYGGVPVGPDFMVNVATTGTQRDARVSIKQGNLFAVSWLDEIEPQVRVRRFDGNGGSFGSPQVVNTDDAGNIYSADVTMNQDGNYLVVWDDIVSLDGTHGRHFDSAGVPTHGPEFRIETLTKYQQFAPHAAMTPDDGFVVVWTGYDDEQPDGYFYGGYGVRAQRFRIAPGPPTTCEPAPRTGCRRPTIHWKGRLTVRDSGVDKSDSLSWKWVRGEATTLQDIGSTLVGGAYTLCIYDASNGRVSQAVVPGDGPFPLMCGGSPCWRALDAVGYKYGDKAGSHDGIQKILLKAGPEGTAKAVVKGKGEALDMPPLPLTLPIRVQLVSYLTNACWEAEYRADGVIENTDQAFSGKPHVD